MANSVSESDDSSLSAVNVLRIVNSLKNSSTGDIIYDHLQDILKSTESTYQDIIKILAELVGDLIQEYSHKLSDDPRLQVHTKILKQRLESPLTLSDVYSLRNFINRLINTGENATKVNIDQAIESALQSLIKTYSKAENQEAARPAANTRDLYRDKVTEHDAGESQLLSDRRVDLTYRKHLDEKRERIQKIQDILTRHVGEVIKQNEKFGVLLEVEHEALQQTNSIDELNTLKQTLLNEVGNLMRGHYALTTKLDSASKYLRIIETEGQHLNDELTRVHILSLTDELTELPNRRAYMRRLEDEVARVQRYGYPLSLALIDMDSFKAINDQYGHAAGDEVLRNFANNILSIFRHHDMVARYGGEEFAVLLPNTDSEGALRALQKVKARTAKTPFEYNGMTMPMPTFSAGISLYKPGETPGSLIERADKALYQAKRMGRNRIELASHDTADLSNL